MGSDDASVMTQKELMRQLYSLQKESVENDARLQAEMDGLNRRLDKQERTFEKISEVLAEQKSFFSSLNGMNWKLQSACNGSRNKKKEAPLKIKMVKRLRENSKSYLHGKIYRKKDWIFLKTKVQRQRLHW